MPPYQGRDRIVWWLMALLSAAIITITGAAFQDYFSQHRRLEERMDAVEREVICLRRTEEVMASHLKLPDPHCAGMVR